MNCRSITNDSTGENDTKYTTDQQLPRSESIAFAVAFAVEFVTIIIGNTIVIAVFARTKQLRERKSHWLLINLAIADCLVGAITGPLLFFFLAFDSDLWDYKYMSKLYRLTAAESVSFYPPNTSLVCLVLISLERMYATLWPFKHRVLRARHYRVMIGLSWILPIILPFVSAAERYGQISRLEFNYIWLFASVFLLSLVVVSYAIIWIKIKFFKNPMNRLSTAQDRKLTVSLFIVTTVSYMTCLPGVFLSVAIYLPPLNKLFSAYGVIYTDKCAALLFFLNSMVNPIIYSFRIPKFRKAALKLLCRRSADEMRVPEMEMRNRPEVINRQASPATAYSPKRTSQVNDTWL